MQEKGEGEEELTPEEVEELKKFVEHTGEVADRTDIKLGRVHEYQDYGLKKLLGIFRKRKREGRKRLEGGDEGETNR